MHAFLKNHFLTSVLNLDTVYLSAVSVSNYQQKQPFKAIRTKTFWQRHSRKSKEIISSTDYVLFTFRMKIIYVWFQIKEIKAC